MSCRSSHKTFHYKRYNVIMNVSWLFIKSQKNVNIRCWKINVLYIYMFFIQMKTAFFFFFFFFIKLPHPVLKCCQVIEKINK